jgi:hypothetical protein
MVLVGKNVLLSNVVIKLHCEIAVPFRSLGVEDLSSAGPEQHALSCAIQVCSQEFTCPVGEGVR